MNHCDEIKTVIIDDNNEFLQALSEHLAIFPEIKIVGNANHYKDARKLLMTTKPDLVFLDVEMPEKNGFELLTEIKDAGKAQFSVIFYTLYEKYMIDALREAAFDFLIKPLHVRELKTVIERFKQQRQHCSFQNQAEIKFDTSFNEKVAIPSLTGLQFINKNKIVLIQSAKNSFTEKQKWELLLNNFEEITIKKNSSAKEILQLMGNNNFIQINQSCIININYLGAIAFKSRECQLVPPFAHLKLTVSRMQMTDLKDRFDLL